MYPPALVSRKKKKKSRGLLNRGLAGVSGLRPSLALAIDMGSIEAQSSCRRWVALPLLASGHALPSRAFGVQAAGALPDACSTCSRPCSPRLRTSASPSPPWSSPRHRSNRKQLLLPPPPCYSVLAASVTCGFMLTGRQAGHAHHNKCNFAILLLFRCPMKCQFRLINSLDIWTFFR